MGHQLLCNQWVLCGASSHLLVCLSFNCEFVHHESTNQSYRQSVKPSIIHSSKQASKEASRLARHSVSQAQLEVCFTSPRNQRNLTVWLAFPLPFRSFPALQSLPLLQVPDWHPGVPASNQEIFSQDSWQVNMENFFLQLVTTYPGVVGKLILDLVNVSHSSSSACSS